MEDKEKEKELTDNCPMPFGKFKGEAMADVTAHHLLWFHDQFKDKKLYGAHVQVFKYVQDNLDALNLEMKSKKR